MDNKAFYELFEKGKLVLPEGEKNFADLPWNPHKKFEGVELKHIVTSEDTGGAYSYHLIRVAPGKSIGEHSHHNQVETHEVIAGKGTCINGGAEYEYEPGCVTIFRADTVHQVIAGDEGVMVFAKFFPALK